MLTSKSFGLLILRHMNKLVLFFVAIPIGTFHLLTTLLAFTKAGFWGGVLTFVIPAISELYWVIKLWNINSIYTILAIYCVIVALIYRIGVFINTN